VLQRQDLLKDIMERRAAQLEGLYPQFKEEFLQLERKLKEHAVLLKGRQDAGSEELMQHVLEELELKEYKLQNEKHTQRTGRSPRKHMAIAEQAQSNRPHESQRSSEMSDTGFRPYHISNFKRSLQSFRIHLPHPL
jgi:hypothetical protein